MEAILAICSHGLRSRKRVQCMDAIVNVGFDNIINIMASLMHYFDNLINIMVTNVLFEKM